MTSYPEGLTDDVFLAMLEEIVDGMDGAELLAIPGVYEVLSEVLHDDIVACYREMQPEDEEQEQEEE